MSVIDDEIKTSILCDLNNHSTSRKLTEKLGNRQSFAYCDGYIDAILWMLKNLGYTYHSRINQKLDCEEYTDIVESKTDEHD